MKPVTHSDRTDAIIRAAYQSTNYGKGAVLSAIKKTGFSAGTVNRRAGELGLLTQTRRQYRWDDWQLDILRNNAHKSMVAINAMIVRRGGPSRPASAIYAQISKLGIKIGEERIGKAEHTIPQAAAVLGVDPSVVRRYIATGMLAVENRGDTSRADYVTDAALRQLIKTYTPQIRVNKIDPFWIAEQLKS